MILPDLVSFHCWKSPSSYWNAWGLLVANKLARCGETQQDTIYCCVLWIYKRNSQSERDPEGILWFGYEGEVTNYWHPTFSLLLIRMVLPFISGEMLIWQANLILSITLATLLSYPGSAFPILFKTICSFSLGKLVCCSSECSWITQDPHLQCPPQYARWIERGLFYKRLGCFAPESVLVGFPQYSRSL